MTICGARMAIQIRVLWTSLQYDWWIGNYPSRTPIKQPYDGVDNWPASNACKIGTIRPVVRAKAIGNDLKKIKSARTLRLGSRRSHTVLLEHQIDRARQRCFWFAGGGCDVGGGFHFRAGVRHGYS